MVLPGKMAKETRAKFADVLTRYMAGDGSLIGEIHANALSTSPIAQLARGGDGGATSGSSLGKRSAGEEPTMELICVELKKNNDSVLAVVATHNTQTNEKMDKINEKTMERMDKSDAKIDKLDDDVVFVKATVVTLVDNQNKVSTLTAMVKASDMKAKHCEHISYKTRGVAGAAASKKYKLIRKELAAEKLKVDVLMRQRTDSDKRIQQLEVGQAELKAGQAEIIAGQAAILACLAAMQPKP